MKAAIKFIFIILLIIPVLGSGQTNHQKRLSYIKKYKQIAIEEMNQFGIPASITLAQGILESNAGQSRLAKKGNNHFGIKCHKGWDGKKMYKSDDRIAECFRKYDDPAFSFRDHSLFLVNRSRYSELFEYDITDYKSWAHGLKKAGYATNPRYAHLLIKIIKDLDLHRFDKKYKPEPVASRDPMMTAPLPSKERFEVVDENQNYTVYENNGKQLVIAGKTDSYLKIAHQHGIQKNILAKYNDLYRGGELSEGELVYLENKRWRSKNYKIHYVRANETWHSIAQLYGVRMAWLKLYNPFEGALKKGDKVRLKLF